MSLVHGQVDYKNPLVRIFFYLSKQNSESAFSGHDLHTCNKRLFIIAPKQRKVNKQILLKFTFTFFVILFVFLSLGFMLWIGGTCATKRRFVGFGSGHKPIHGQLIHGACTTWLLWLCVGPNCVNKPSIQVGFLAISFLILDHFAPNKDEGRARTILRSPPHDFCGSELYFCLTLRPRISAIANLVCYVSGLFLEIRILATILQIRTWLGERKLCICIYYQKQHVHANKCLYFDI